MADEERREKKSRRKEKMENFKKLLEESGLTSKATFSDFATKANKDERFKGIDKRSERENLFNDYMSDLRKKEKEERAAKRDQIKKEFVALLKEKSDLVDRHAHWSDVKKELESEDRYKAVESSTQREDWFLDYVHILKDEHRREKEKKKRERSRDRSRSRDRDSDRKKKRSRSRSRSRDRKDKKDKKKKRSRSNSRDRDESKEAKKRRKEEEKERKREEKERRREEREKDKEEGEMLSEEDDAKSKRSTHDEDEDGEIKDRRRSRTRSVEKSKDESRDDKESDGDEEKDDGKKRDGSRENEGVGEKDVEMTEEEREEKERREKEERIAASIKKREAEVARELSGHLHARDMERQQHRHADAITRFDALLADLIKHPDYTWKEAKKVLKKDSRYDSIASDLEKSEREKQFDDHIDRLVAKKKDNYRRLLEECKEIRLDSSFKDIRKLIKEDPRYTRYSSSDRKCEKAFNEFLKDKVMRGLSAFKELLQETKKITDKSLSLVKDAESGHMAEIIELLSKDKRYLDLESMADERSSLLTTYLEDMEKRGPPPPPTASEPQRRK